MSWWQPFDERRVDRARASRRRRDPARAPQSRGDQRAARQRGLDHQHAAGEPADQAVAAREVLRWPGACRGGTPESRQPSVRELRGELRVARRIDDGRRPVPSTAMLEPAAGEARRDARCASMPSARPLTIAEPAVGQRMGEGRHRVHRPAGCSCGCRRSRNTRPLSSSTRPTHIQDRGRIGDLEQRAWVRGVAQRDEVMAWPARASAAWLEQSRDPGLRQAFGHVARQRVPTAPPTRPRPPAARASRRRAAARAGAGRNARDEREAKPGFDIVA